MTLVLNCQCVDTIFFFFPTKDQIQEIEKKFGLHDKYFKHRGCYSVCKQARKQYIVSKASTVLYSNKWYADIVEEMESKCPDLLHVLVCDIG